MIKSRICPNLEGFVTPKCGSNDEICTTRAENIVELKKKTVFTKVFLFLKFSQPFNKQPWHNGLE